MLRSSSFGGVILAAGESSRMGSEKALLAWPAAEGGTFLSGAIQSLAPSTDFVLVVAGKNEAALSPIAYASGASIVVNPDPSRGQFSSLQIALREVLNRGRDGAIITLIDRPPAKPETAHALREALNVAPQNVWAVVPEYSGKHGHPYVVSREMIEEFLREPATGNARDVEHRHQEHISYIPVDDRLVVLNINTPEEYAALQSYLQQTIPR